MPEGAPDLSTFYQFVREERLFCAVLAHLLWQRGPNLGAFIELVNHQLSEDSRLPSSSLEQAQIYIEFSFLRDSWDSLDWTNDSLDEKNDAKRQRIFSLLSKVPSLAHYRADDFPGDISKFNARFVGSRGKDIREDIVYPGRWSVGALYQQFKHSPLEFLAFCKFKWSFNIKPDLVILVPGSRPLCVEAKLVLSCDIYRYNVYSGHVQKSHRDHIDGSRTGHPGVVGA